MSRGDAPAFPVPAHVDGRQDFNPPEYGMTKREEFAKAAMQGLCANPSLFSENVLRNIVRGAGRTEMSPPEIVAMLAREQADAILAELDKNP